MEEECGDAPTPRKYTTVNDTQKIHRKYTKDNDAACTDILSMSQDLNHMMAGGGGGLLEALRKYHCWSRFAETNSTDCQMDRSTYMYRELSQSLGCSPSPANNCYGFGTFLKKEIESFLTDKTGYEKSAGKLYKFEAILSDLREITISEFTEI